MYGGWEFEVRLYKVMSSLGERCGYELGRSGLAYRALKLGRVGFRGANDVLEQTGRAPFARHC